MSSDDGDRGPWDDLQDEWNQSGLIFEWNNPDAPEGWQNWEEHDIQGSHWTVESEHFMYHEDALRTLEDMQANPSDYLEGNNNPGQFATLEIWVDEDTGEYYIHGEAYVEYN